MADPDQYSEAETKRRMEDALRRALTTPHKPHAKLRGKAAATTKQKATARKKGPKRS